MNTLILAAGRGERLKPYTSILPKPAIPFLNLPMGFFCIDLLSDLKIENLVINTHHLPDQIRTYFSPLKKEFPSLHFTWEETLLGGGGTLKENLTSFQSPSPILSLNSDSFLLYTNNKKTSPAKQALDLHKENRAAATLLLIEHPEAGKSLSAAWCDQIGRIYGFGKNPPQTSKTLKPFHFVGLQIIEKDLVHRLPEGPSNIIQDLYQSLVQNPQSTDLIQGLVLPKARWFETGNLKDYLKATEYVLQKLIDGESFSIFETVLKKGFPHLKIQDSIARVNPMENKELTSDYPLFLGHGVKVHPSVKFEGFAVIGDNVTLEKGSVLKNVVIGNNVFLKENSLLENNLVLGSALTDTP